MTLKVYSANSMFHGQLGIGIFKSVQYICQFTLLDFHYHPRSVFFPTRWKTHSWMSLQKISEHSSFPRWLSSPYQSNEIGYKYFSPKINSSTRVRNLIYLDKEMLSLRVADNCLPSYNWSHLLDHHCQSWKLSQSS